MLALWSAKGGVGTSVTAAAVALRAAATNSSPPLLVDLAGDQPLCLGLTQASGPGVAEWSHAGRSARPDSLARLIEPCPGGIDLLARGQGPIEPDRMALLIQLLAVQHRPVIIDAGLLPGSVAATQVVLAARWSLMVTRNCFLAAVHSSHCAVLPTGVILINEAGRALTTPDLAGAIGAPVAAEIEIDPAIARATDAGTLIHRLPRSLSAAGDRILAATINSRPIEQPPAGPVGIDGPPHHETAA